LEPNRKGAELPMTPPFRFLHADTSLGFKEYEFRADGTVVAYYDLEKTPVSRKYISLEKEQPSFKVELFAWRRENDQIVVIHKDNEEFIPVAADGGRHTSDKDVWVTTEHLEFIPRIFSYCERPLPKNPDEKPVDEERPPE
jgi:hypothetical protein